MCFEGTPSRIKGIGFEHMQADLLRLHDFAWPSGVAAGPGAVPGTAGWSTVQLRNPGDLHYRDGGEAHYNSPKGMAELQVSRLLTPAWPGVPQRQPISHYEQCPYCQVAARTNSREAYAGYARTMVEAAKRTSVRGLLAFREDVMSISLDEVEPAAEIVKRFCTGAMSLGSISMETHETLALAMNQLGGKSNTGEYGAKSTMFTLLCRDDSRLYIGRRGWRGSAPLRGPAPLLNQAGRLGPFRRHLRVRPARYVPIHPHSGELLTFRVWQVPD